MRPYLRQLSALGWVFACACVGEQPPPSSPAVPPARATASASTVVPPAKAPAETIASESSRTTPAGATFTAPAGWTLQVEANATILTGPEPDLRMVISDGPAKSAESAVAAAWSAIRRDFSRPLKLITPRPGRHGWDDRRDFDYETSPNEKVFVFAYALRHGEGWIAAAIESGQASFEKRYASVKLITDSLRPKGDTKESFAGKTALPLDTARIKQLSEFVEQGRAALDLPGIAIGVVQGGKVVFEGGFGVRELGKVTKVDPDTLFMIASNTKALTTLLLATEVEQGKFTWETPVTQVYPSFKLGSAQVTSKVLMKHLVCACTGLPRQDMEWLFEYKNATPKAVMDLLGTMQPTTKFGETFQYSNLMAGAAGFIGGYVVNPKKELGAAYDEAMTTRVFDPLGMKTITFDYGRALGGNHSTPHGPRLDGKMAVASIDLDRSIIPARPAGGAWASVRDLTKYVQLELAKGKLPSGKQLLSEQNLTARRRPQVSRGENKAYGMGLAIDSDAGVTMVGHTGGMPGFYSQMFWLPEHGVGAVILTNGEGGWLMLRPFYRKILELLFDGRAEAAEDLAAAARSRKAEIAKAAERLVVPPEPQVIAKLAKRYKNAALGELVIRLDGPTHVLDAGEWKSAFASRKNDDQTVSLITIDPGMGAGDGFEFVLSEREGKRMLVLRDMQHEYEFVETK